MSEFQVGSTVWVYVCFGERNAISIEDFYLCECTIVKITQQNQELVFIVHDKDDAFCNNEPLDYEVSYHDMYETKHEAIVSLMEKLFPIT